MHVTFTCPQCEQTSRAAVDESSTQFACEACGAKVNVPQGALVDGHLHRCVCCPSDDLYVRKDFPQRLGVAIVVLGFALSCIAYARYQIVLALGLLFAVAAIDVLLYVLIPDCLMCYACHAIYRGVPHHDDHASFSLDTHERYRQQAARLAEAGKPTAGRG